ncbi:hypothetical protein J437_LFUL015991 [Ladona fulva]|uniref:Uncharacterized protein n=1 Tax=Ladona fulva TaxID=123851 RepID=A0A8K0K964_LADFU|nr:hypothetical protein J437_LFUL015991 [Ladona fulva]
MLNSYPNICIMAEGGRGRGSVIHLSSYPQLRSTVSSSPMLTKLDPMTTVQLSSHLVKTTSPALLVTLPENPLLHDLLVTYQWW